MIKFFRQYHVVLILLSILFIFSTSCGSKRRQSIAEEFLEALQKHELTAQNAISQYEKYGISLLSLHQIDSSGMLSEGDIYFPIVLIDYKYLSEESIPRGIVTHSVKNLTKLFERGYGNAKESPEEEATKVFNKIKEELEQKKAKDLKIDEVNKTISYYDESPESYKLYYLITVTNRLGTTLKKNAFVRIKDNQIVEFKY